MHVLSDEWISGEPGGRARNEGTAGGEDGKMTFLNQN